MDVSAFHIVSERFLKFLSSITGFFKHTLTHSCKSFKFFHLQCWIQVAPTAAILTAKFTSEHTEIASAIKSRTALAKNIAQERNHLVFYCQNLNQFQLLYKTLEGFHLNEDLYTEIDREFKRKVLNKTDSCILYNSLDHLRSKWTTLYQK